jgi:hypothetical protein
MAYDEDAGEWSSRPRTRDFGHPWEYVIAALSLINIGFANNATNNE